MDNEQSQDTEVVVEEIINDHDTSNNHNINGSVCDSNENQISNQNNTHSIQITTEDPVFTHFTINNVPKDITVEELRTLMINSEEFHLNSDSFSFIEDDMLLFDDNFIRGDAIKLLYHDNHEKDYFTIFLLLHLFPILFYFTHSYPIELSIMIYLVMILFFGFFLRIQKKMVIKQAGRVLKKIMILFKLVFLFFYSMLPFFNADNLD